MQVVRSIVGIDVAKAELVIHFQGKTLTIENTPQAIKRWLKSLPCPCEIAIEATGTYHMAVIELAHAKGHHIYVIDASRLSSYRKGTGGRAKTDASDAQLLARHLQREKEDLRRWSPPPKAYRTLQTLLRRRAALIKARTMIQQSLGGEKILKASLKKLISQINSLDTLIQKHLRDTVREAGLSDQVQRCKALEGVGDLTAYALVMAFLRGDFRNSDAFVAFLGMDVHVKDSGTRTGKRKLTKKGDSETRRLLYCAAMAARKSARWASVYQGYLDRGLAKTQALVILARKLVRIAFALMKNRTSYAPSSAA